MTPPVDRTSHAIALRRAGAVRWLLVALVLAEIVSAAESTMIFGAMRALLREVPRPMETASASARRWRDDAETGWSQCSAR